MILKTICPYCKSINKSELGEMETSFFEGNPYLWYPTIIVCFYCKHSYAWVENLHRKWIGIPIPS